MSNPQTFYTVGGVDLSNIFQSYDPSGNKATATGYTVTGYGDLNNIFTRYTSGAQASATGYKVGLSDLNLIFAPLIFTTTGGSIVTYTNSTYVITFTTNGTMKFISNVLIPTTVNYLFVGGGAGGGSGNGGGGGGGGAGGQVKYFTNVFGSTPTTTLTFTVAVAPPLVAGTPADGNPTICSGTGITTITASGGLKGGNTTTGTGAVGGVGSSGGGNGGTGGDYNSSAGTQGTAGSTGSSHTINGITYWFGGGGAGGNNSTGSPAGGLGGGGGSGGAGNGNNAVNPYTGPNGISQTFTSAGYNNSGGGGSGCNGDRVNLNRAGSSGIVVVWFSYP